MKCLYCGKETTGYFCAGGGQTLAAPKTGEKDVTKSYCYNDFLIILGVTEKLGAVLSDEEKYYRLWEPQIKAWYSSIPLIFDNGKKVVPLAQTA